MTLLNLIRVERKQSKAGAEYFTGVVIADTEITLKPGDQVMMFQARKEANNGATFNLTCERFEYAGQQTKQPPGATVPARGFGRQNAADPAGATTTSEAKARYDQNPRWKPQDARTEVLGHGHTATPPKPAYRSPKKPASGLTRPSKAKIEAAAAASIKMASAGRC